jgi:hypothetical protein
MEDKYLKKLHVTFDDGKELVGVDAFIYVWNRTKGYRWLGTFVRTSDCKTAGCFYLFYSCFFTLLAL